MEVACTEPGPSLTQRCLTARLGRERRGTMTKADLIDEVSRLAELTRKDSEVIVETIFDSVVRSLRAGDKIEIRGDRKSTRLNSSHSDRSRMPSSA